MRRIGRVIRYVSCRVEPPSTSSMGPILSRIAAQPSSVPCSVATPAGPRRLSEGSVNSCFATVPRMLGEDDNLRELLGALDPPARDTLRLVLIHDQTDRDAIASELMRYRDE